MPGWWNAIHARLKIVWAQAREGWTPSPGTRRIFEGSPPHYNTLPSMKITYDQQADAMYIYFKKGKIYDTNEIGAGFIVDQDKNGDVLGLEILNASRNLKMLKKKPQITLGNRSILLPNLALKY